LLIAEIWGFSISDYNMVSMVGKKAGAYNHHSIIIDSNTSDRTMSTLEIEYIVILIIGYIL